MLTFRILSLLLCLLVSGQALGALNFDAVNDSVTVANHTSLQLGANHTIAFWLKKNSEPSGWQRLIGKGIDTQRNYTIWDAASGDTRLHYSLHTGAGHFGLYSTSGLEVNRWYHVVATYDGSALAFHLNGTASGSAAATGTPVTSTAAVLFGYAGYAGTYMSGALDGVRLYQRTLTAAEIAGLTPQLKRRYTYGHDLISVTEVGTSTVTHYYGYDGHGSVRFLTDSASGASTQITDWYDYDAYGQLLATDGTTVNHYRYTGEQWDNDLGMYYLRARYLNPNTGRFWTMDSYEGSSQDPLSLHKYLYCHGSPVNLVDPSGYFTSTAEVGISTTIATRMQTMAISAAVSAYLTYAIYSGAKAMTDDRELRRVAQNLGVEVEPAVYLTDLRNKTDWGGDSRKRDPGSEYFAHGTSTGAWKDSTSILASGGGDFGTGFYTFKADLQGLFWAGGRATRTASSPQGGGLPFILVVKIKREVLSGMMATALDLGGDATQWTTTVTGYLNNGGQGLSGHPIVIGPVSAQGRRLNPGETPTQRTEMPDQWKWEDVSKLERAAIIPVFNGFNRKLAW